MGKLSYSVLFSVMSLALAAGCGDSTSDAGGGGSGGTNAGAGNQGGDPGTGGEGPGDAGFCALGCAEAADCCLAGAVDCPGEYPNDWSCDGGVCAYNGCTEDAQCQADGALPDYICLSTGGCAEGCKADADCTPGTNTTCIGDDGGTAYCSIGEVEVDPCTTDADCNDFGVCDVDSGICGCTIDDDCAVEGYVCAL